MSNSIDGRATANSGAADTTFKDTALNAAVIRKILDALLRMLTGKLSALAGSRVVRNACERLVAGDRDPALGRALCALIADQGTEVDDLCKMLKDELSRPSAPARLSVRTVAWLMCVSQTKVRSYVKEGRLAVHRVGHRCLLEPADVEWLLRWLYAGDSSHVESLLFADKVAPSTAAGMLNIPLSAVKALVAAGCMPSVNGMVLMSDVAPLLSTRQRLLLASDGGDEAAAEKLPF